MDPNQALEDFYDALAEGDYNAAYEAQDNLIRWMARGGFEPDWKALGEEQKTTYDRASFSALDLGELMGVDPEDNAD